jgi:isoleucyl-tRNA synthetase
VADEFELLPEEVLVDRIATEGYAAASGDGYVAGVSLRLTPELKAEGIAREVVHIVQNLRKDSGLEIADRIDLYVDAPDEVAEALEANGTYVREEVLATELVKGPAPAGAALAEHEVEGHRVAVGLVKR